ncbi:PREDICTED: E3 ubiquitin-protein ligase At3g02290-like [Camelina sativa]|uniref:RING-type E3 ubiquitin transferase n=1 Tax=Camelina sativa TaxID=90675 RepID=A0ABM0V516_CAMSA|nr:PREDICTED: E3 ubiquitin-protein ligase At3g02290-like [Camelina sativa]
MGAFCCCFQVDLFESYVNPNTSMTRRNCPCLNCFLQSFMGLYASLFNRGGMHPIPSTVETATVMNSTTALDDSLSNVYHSPPRPLPYDADPRYFRLVKGSSHSGEESQPLRGDTEMSSEALGGGGKWSKSDCEDGSKELYSKGSSTIAKSKTVPGIENYYAESDDEDICPTCLDDYTPENPKIITKCSHHFHLSCIYEWMERSETCPVCGKVMAFDENETS